MEIKENEARISRGWIRRIMDVFQKFSSFEFYKEHGATDEF